jgi:putative transposase
MPGRLARVLGCDRVAAGFRVPEGWSLQAFSFALDPSPGQLQVLARQFGGRRHAYNWAVRQLKQDIEISRRAGRLS